MEEMEPVNLSAFSFREGEAKHCNNGKSFSSSVLSARENKVVCVTSGNSFLGSHVVRELLARGYLVRVTVQNQVDFEDIKKLLNDVEISKLEGVVVAKMQDLEALCEAFRGCHAVFHTSSFIDPHGVSGYTEAMAFLETEAANKVIEACAKAAYAPRCIFTSSLLASIWVDDNPDRVIDESRWSNEEFCRANKLWLALGKTRAEKTAWRKSKEWRVNLVTLCPGLLMSTSVPCLHKEPSIPYLKGGSIMLQRGLLATVDVSKVAEAHVRVYEAMDCGASGRYLCFNKVILRLDEAIQLENELKVQGLFSSGRDGMPSPEETCSKISNSRLVNLLLGTSQRITCKE